MLLGPFNLVIGAINFACFWYNTSAGNTSLAAFNLGVGVFCCCVGMAPILMEK